MSGYITGGLLAGIGQGIQDAGKTLEERREAALAAAARLQLQREEAEAREQTAQGNREAQAAITEYREGRLDKRHQENLETRREITGATIESRERIAGETEEGRNRRHAEAIKARSADAAADRAARERLTQMRISAARQVGGEAVTRRLSSVNRIFHINPRVITHQGRQVRVADVWGMDRQGNVRNLNFTAPVSGSEGGDVDTDDDGGAANLLSMDD